MVSDFNKAAIIVAINKLREAVEKDDHEEVANHAYHIYAEAVKAGFAESPTKQIVKAIYDILLLKEAKETIPKAVLERGDVQKLYEDVTSICDFLLALANGDLSKKLTTKGYLAGILKGFQSRLKHLAWQTQMVSRGDFTQRVNFMGDFADSFNMMIDQLDQARKNYAESEEKYRRLAITDPLTDLPNRRHFFDVATAEFFRTKRYNNTLSIIMMDIDHFKNINDSYGHHVGDIVLQAVAEQLRGALRTADVPGRYGGEEFIALLPETKRPEALAVAERLKDTLQSKEILADDNEIKVTASFGVCSYQGADDRYQTIEGVIEDADKALYVAKSSGRNRVVVFD